jgi:hypothetical protein
MSAESASKRPGRLRESGLVEVHHLDLQLLTFEGRDRSQPVDPNPFALRVARLVLVGRHLPAGAAVDDQRLLRAEPPGRARRVHGRVPPAVHRHATTDRGPIARRNSAQERHCVDDRPRVHRGDLHALRQVRTDRHEDRVISTLPALGLKIGDTVVPGEAHAEPLDPIDLVAEHVPGQPVGGDPVTHHPARLGAGVANLDVVPEPDQVIGSREPARPRADHEHALAAPNFRWLERPGTLTRQIAEKPLHRVNRDGVVQLRAVAAGLARVVAHPAVDRRKRVVVHQYPPSALMPSRLHLRKPLLDVLPRRARRIARRQEIHIHRPLRPNRTRTGASVEKIRQRCDVPRRVLAQCRPGLSPAFGSLEPPRWHRHAPSIYAQRPQKSHER